MTIDKLNHAKAIAAEIDMLDEQMRRLGSLLRNEENGAMLSLILVKKGITLCSVRIDNLTERGLANMLAGIIADLNEQKHARQNDLASL